MVYIVTIFAAENCCFPGQKKMCISFIRRESLIKMLSGIMSGEDPRREKELFSPAV